jgi:hypothetical protein
MRRAATLIAGVVAAATTTGVARADWEDYQGAGSLEYEAAYLHTVDQDDADPERAVDGLGLAGFRLRGQVGKSWLGYRIGLDLRAGATAPGGFAYDVDLYAVGVGARLGRWSVVGITGGIGASGATGTVDDAMTFPVEASIELALGGRIRVLARGRLTWLAAAPNRDDGSRTVDFADELDATFAIRLGHRWTDWGFPTGNGYFVGVSYRESEGAQMVGVILGHSLDAGTSGDRN